MAFYWRTIAMACCSKRTDEPIPETALHADREVASACLEKR
ncbi:hypothetical protein [Rubidibacter lacunae]|nr:hypothetical protein [Rubidibacter lacunae]